jgi:hypothetical protein
MKNRERAIEARLWAAVMDFFKSNPFPNGLVTFLLRYSPMLRGIVTTRYSVVVFAPLLALLELEPNDADRLPVAADAENESFPRSPPIPPEFPVTADGRDALEEPSADEDDEATEGVQAPPPLPTIPGSG